MRWDQPGQRGQGLVEFAVIFPIFAALLFAVIDGGLLLGRYNNINNSAKEGARLGAVGALHSEIIERIKQQAHGELDDDTTEDCGQFNSFDGNAICVEWISGPDGQAPGTVGSSLRVKIRYEYGFLTPLPNWGVPDHLDIKVCAVQRMEQSFTSAPAKVAGENSC